MIGSAEPKASGSSTVVLIKSDGMGSVEVSLRHTLLRVYLTMLQEKGFYPGAICFCAGGVKMVVHGFPV